MQVFQPICCGLNELCLNDEVALVQEALRKIYTANNIPDFLTLETTGATSRDASILKF
jgi:hypothetical protein